jgi:hypothetical protein
MAPRSLSAVRVPPAAEVLGAQGPVGEHEAVVIQGGAAGQPAGGWVSADEGEQPGARQRFAAAWAGEFHRLQRLIALRAAIVVVGRTVMRGSASIRSIR